MLWTDRKSNKMLVKEEISFDLLQPGEQLKGILV
jgi:hypothetical protein